MRLGHVKQPGKRAQARLPFAGFLRVDILPASFRISRHEEARVLVGESMKVRHAWGNWVCGGNLAEPLRQHAFGKVVRLPRPEVQAPNIEPWIALFPASERSVEFQG